MLEIHTRSSKNRHDTTQENIKTTFIGLRLNMETYLYFLSSENRLPLNTLGFIHALVFIVMFM